MLSSRDIAPLDGGKQLLPNLLKERFSLTGQTAGVRVFAIDNTFINRFVTKGNESRSVIPLVSLTPSVLCRQLYAVLSFEQLLVPWCDVCSSALRPYGK